MVVEFLKVGVVRVVDDWVREGVEVGREEVRAEYFINLILKSFSLIYVRFYFIKSQTGKSYKNHTTS